MNAAMKAFFLNDKTAVVTGAAAGIGEATARLFAAAGASVMLTDIDSQRCEQVTAELRDAGANVRCMALDVSREADWQTLQEALAEWTGRWDILMNNAGIYIGGTVESNTTEQLQRIHDINVASVFFPLCGRVHEAKRRSFWPWGLHH